MHVEDLLHDTALDLDLLWGDGALLTREISGVTATDLEDPTRFLRAGEVVLSGLVWWGPEQGREKTDRFVAALAAAGAAALLAGEETHGTVPDALVDACRTHGIALVAVPPHTNFRAIIDAVYLRQWGDLSRRPSGHHALPENVRIELSRLLESGADAATLLDRALAHLGTPACHLLTATGRTVARTPTAPPLAPAEAVRRLTRPSGISLRIETDATEYDATAYDSWHLYLHDPDEAPPRLLHEIADVVARHQERRSREESGARERAAALLVLMDAAAREPEGPALRAALRACALPEEGPYQVVAADVGGAAAGGAGRQTVQPTAALGALTEALRHLPGGPAFAVGALPDGTVAAVVHVAGLGDDPADGSQREGGQLGGRQREGVQLDDGQQDGVQLEGIWPLLTACTPHAPVHGGIGDTARTPERLRRSLTQARYALAAARSAAPRRGELTHTRDMTTLPALLAGVPDDVRSAFLARTLGTLTDDTDQSQRTLLHTLETYLAHNGSWARTAEALHLHVNTVHYRIQRIETLTGRDLSRLDHKLDLYAALRCR